MPPPREQSAPDPRAAGASPFLHFLACAASYFQDQPLDATTLQGVFTDPDEIDVRFACNQARLSPAEVMDADNREHRMQQKRRHFFALLIDRGWALSQIQYRFPTAKLGYLKKVRAALRRRKSTNHQSTVLSAHRRRRNP